ncbi:MAG: nitrile hydratase accessory protein [Gammaproteobacteria bacterium]|nr:nitrile hydratase accessory protein [Gammaproteobacteria bacterium]MBI5615646.1 nitrile hydratase accessory protein [Gammaproteobacteria bacterium]
MTGADDLAAAKVLAEIAAEAGGEPMFEQPWHAQAFAMTMHLAKRGVFDWDEWVGAFIPEVREHPQAEGEDVNAAYFRQWLAALEKLLAARGLCTPDGIDDYAATWRRAYLNTAHGDPVEFSAGRRPVGEHGEHTHEHFHDPRSRERTPVAVSPRSGT